jgi:hypothetical protein
VITGLFVAVAAVALLLASARDDHRNRRLSDHNTREGQ